MHRYNQENYYSGGNCRRAAMPYSRMQTAALTPAPVVISPLSLLLLIISSLIIINLVLILLGL
jgi:hypothetical protein